MNSPLSIKLIVFHYTIQSFKLICVWTHYAHSCVSPSFVHLSHVCPSLTHGYIATMGNHKYNGAWFIFIAAWSFAYIIQETLGIWTLTQYRKFHCRDKKIVRSSYLHNGISYTGKMTSLYWIRALQPGSVSTGYFQVYGRDQVLYVNDRNPYISQTTIVCCNTPMVYFDLAFLNAGISVTFIHNSLNRYTI